MRAIHLLYNHNDNFATGYAIWVFQVLHLQHFKCILFANAHITKYRFTETVTFSYCIAIVFRNIVFNPKTSCHSHIYFDYHTSTCSNSQFVAIKYGTMTTKKNANKMGCLVYSFIQSVYEIEDLQNGVPATETIHRLCIVLKRERNQKFHQNAVV